MPTPFSHEHAKVIYDIAVGAQKGRDFVYAIQLFNELLIIDDALYTPYALSALAQCYGNIQRNDLALGALKRITGLPDEQRNLLHPLFLSSCYEKVGDFKSARTVVESLLKLTPDDVRGVAAVAEISLLEGNLPEAKSWARKLQERAEPPYQILGRLITAVALGQQNKRDDSMRDLLWIGNYIISVGTIQLGVWDYTEIVPLAEKMGPNSEDALLLLQVLSGRMAVPEFIEKWKKHAVVPEQAS